MNFIQPRYFLYRLFKQKILSKCFNSTTSSSRDVEFSQIILSTSENIYSNLAFEDWLFRYSDLSNSHHKILLWRNTHAVVIGRHQNPWLECDLRYLKDNNCMLARRNSGGGTVYHDLGNLNVCFLTKQDHYDRKKNLLFLCHVLKKHWNINAEISSREDLMVENQKISGTASKLSQKKNSYHHCTLLLDVSMEKLRKALHKEKYQIESKATESVRSKITNLKNYNEDINFNSLVKSITKEYSKIHLIADEILHVDPLKLNLENFHDIRNELKTWKWIFGKTPKFNIKRSIDFRTSKVFVQVTIFRGLITDIFFDTPIIPVVDIEKFIDLTFTEESFMELQNECFESQVTKSVILPFFIDLVRSI